MDTIQEGVEVDETMDQIVSIQIGDQVEQIRLKPGKEKHSQKSTIPIIPFNDEFSTLSAK